MWNGPPAAMLEKVTIVRRGSRVDVGIGIRSINIGPIPPTVASATHHSEAPVGEIDNEGKVIAGASTVAIVVVAARTKHLIDAATHAQHARGTTIPKRPGQRAAAKP